MTTKSFIQDSVLSASTCAGTGAVVSPDANGLIQTLIPVIVGIVSPLIKDWIANRRRKRKERQEAKK